MTIPAVDAWTLARLLAGYSMNGELESTSPARRRLVEHLAALNKEERLHAWEAGKAALPAAEADSLIRAISEADPAGPPPESAQAQSFATLADVERLGRDTPWIWEGWIPSARVCGLAAQEGTGKTRLLLDICQRMYTGREWPDGQPPSLPAGTRSVWVAADGHQDEMAETARAFGLPLEAVVLPACPEEPYEGTSLDDPETVDAIRSAVEAVQPGMVVIDTLTFATQRDLCRQNEMAGLRDPLVKLAQDYGVPVILAMHLNKEGTAFGRRVRGLTRALHHLEEPDPESQPGRLRFWVAKSYAAKPPALGVTLGPSGNDYDSDPPQKPDQEKRSRGGRPPVARKEAEAFILDELAKQNDQKATSMRDAWLEAGGANATFWSARNSLVADGRVIQDGEPYILHLVAEPES